MEQNIFFLNFGVESFILYYMIIKGVCYMEKYVWMLYLWFYCFRIYFKILEKLKKMWFCFYGKFCNNRSLCFLRCMIRFFRYYGEFIGMLQDN